MRAPMPRMGRRGKMLLVVAVTLVLVLIVLGSLVDVLTDRLWFREVHYSQVFSTMIWTRVVLFLLVGVITGVIVVGSMYLAYRMRPLLRPTSPEQQALERYRMLLQPRIGWWIGILGGLIGLFAGISGQAHWQTWLLFSNGGKFGVKDPQFGTDIGWYVFDYPWWRYLVSLGFTAVTLALIGAMAMHYIFGGIRLQGGGDRLTTAARAQLSALIAAFVLLKAVSYVLDKRGLLLNNIASVNSTGAGYTDVNAVIPAKTILAWISVIVAIAIVVFANAFMRNLVWPGMAIGLLVVSAIAIDGIYPFAVQQFVVKPNLPSKEITYIQRSIDATRVAFGLDKIDDTTYSAGNNTPPPTLATDTGTVPNIRLLDPAVVADTYTQLQRARGFYDFGKKLDIDRYTQDGKTQDYVVGIREIDYNSPAGQSWNWQNAHTIYTHGYGFVGAPANKTVCDGAPYFVSGVLNTGNEQGSAGEACFSNSDQFPAPEQGIYYGEGMGGYAVVGQPAGKPPIEYGGPVGSANSQGQTQDTYVTYTGKGGVPVGGFMTRLLYAYKFKEPNFVISGIFNKDSKVLYVRDPRERVQKIAPFLTIDGDPYPAVVDGRITWILDGYTTASTYPYSNQVDLQSATSDAQVGAGVARQASTDINYLRNSVKATVDAYDGTVTLYKFGPDDPIVDAWNKAFGGNLIKPESAIPDSLKAHFRYPEDQFNVQRDLLTRFHVTDARDFFSGQDFWQVPNDPADENSGLKQPPYYLLAQFPDQTTPTFQLTAAMTLRTQPNLSALLTGSYTADGTPTLKILETTGSQVLGPTQAQQKMQNDPTIRQQLTLFTSSTSQVDYGNLLSLPLYGGILYVEPVYIRSTASNSYPLMRKVLLSYGDFVAFDDDVNSGINDLINAAKTGQPNPPTTGNPPPVTQPGTGVTSPAVQAAVQNINKALADLKAAQQSGDFTKYGAALDELNAAVKAYQAAVANASPKPGTPSPSPSG